MTPVGIAPAVLLIDPKFPRNVGSIYTVLYNRQTKLLLNARLDDRLEESRGFEVPTEFGMKEG